MHERTKSLLVECGFQNFGWTYIWYHPNQNSSIVLNHIDTTATICDEEDVAIEIIEWIPDADPNVELRNIARAVLGTSHFRELLTSHPART